ncbi:predicted protein [Coccidioides posadasii str. Silveira]|uniref:Predicted protein n=2 Tax=Coccidioides posadasii TaxID=199306 RepID=E9DJU8_COCPS|nr:predicted protein [Coccidioides posadasii str. Silveira]KMM66036.1 hypothetical protein CPAG_02376 [Coccidioides posadasii RMSCC 3488]
MSQVSQALLVNAMKSTKTYSVHTFSITNIMNHRRRRDVSGTMRMPPNHTRLIESYLGAGESNPKRRMVAGDRFLSKERLGIRSSRRWRCEQEREQHREPPGSKTELRPFAWPQREQNQKRQNGLA